MGKNTVASGYLLIPRRTYRRHLHRGILSLLASSIRLYRPTISPRSICRLVEPSLPKTPRILTSRIVGSCGHSPITISSRQEQPWNFLFGESSSCMQLSSVSSYQPPGIVYLPPLTHSAVLLPDYSPSSFLHYAATDAHSVFSRRLVIFLKHTCIISLHNIISILDSSLQLLRQLFVLIYVSRCPSRSSSKVNGPSRPARGPGKTMNTTSVVWDLRNTEM